MDLFVGGRSLSVLIVSVEPRKDFWKIRTDEGRTVYTTKNWWVASIAERCMKTKTPVGIASSAGWYFREIISIKPADGEAFVAP
jgi:hypothetical protein